MNKTIIASGEDATIHAYVPSYEHNLDNFRERMEIRRLRELNTVEGSVNAAALPAPVKLLTWAEAVDVFDEVKGG
jgi:hypothetical protein